MSEEAMLFLLKQKLSEIRTKRIVSWIGTIVIGIILAIGLEISRLDQTTSFFVGGLVALGMVSVLDDYYRKQKDALMRQIEQMAFRKVV